MAVWNLGSNILSVLLSDEEPLLEMLDMKFQTCISAVLYTNFFNLVY